MDIQFIINELDKIDARSIHFPLRQEECIYTYRELLKLKESFLMLSFSEVSSDTLEDVRFRLIENTILYRQAIKEYRHISTDRESGQLNLLYEGGIA